MAAPPFRRFNIGIDDEYDGRLVVSPRDDDGNFIGLVTDEMCEFAQQAIQRAIDAEKGKGDG